MAEDDVPPDSSPPPADNPPLLDYAHSNEIDTEPWPKLIRALLIVFGILGFFVILFYGFCGGLIGGCG